MEKTLTNTEVPEDSHHSRLTGSAKSPPSPKNNSQLAWLMSLGSKQAERSLIRELLPQSQLPLPWPEVTPATEVAKFERDTNPG